MVVLLRTSLRWTMLATGSGSGPRKNPRPRLIAQHLLPRRKTIGVPEVWCWQVGVLDNTALGQEVQSAVVAESLLPSCLRVLDNKTIATEVGTRHHLRRDLRHRRRDGASLVVQDSGDGGRVPGRLPSVPRVQAPLHLHPLPSFAMRMFKALKMVTLDQAIGAPLVNAGFMFLFTLATALTTGSGALEAGSQAGAKLKNNLWGTLLVCWRIWPVANTINFAFVPAKLRVLFMNFVGLGWNIYLSAAVN
ncbi:unnamed protein product [Pylaiella littoralis]